MFRRSITSLLFGLLFGILFCFPLSAAQLLEIKITDPGQGQLKKIMARAYLEASPEQVWQAISGYAHYPEFLPRVSSSHIDRRNANVTIATMKLDLPFPMKGTWYTNRYVEDKAVGTIHWKMLRGSLKSTVGRWKISPQGKGTLV